MSVPKHTASCHGKAFPSFCPKCNERVYYFACSCGKKIFYQELGGEWPEHTCTPKTEKKICPICGKDFTPARYAKHACKPTDVKEVLQEKAQAAAVPAAKPAAAASSPAVKKKYPAVIPMSVCVHCGAKIGPRRMKIHLKRCPKKNITK